MGEMKKIGYLLTEIKKNTDEQLNLIAKIHDGLSFSRSPIGVARQQKLIKRTAQKSQIRGESTTDKHRNRGVLASGDNRARHSKKQTTRKSVNLSLDNTNKGSNSTKANGDPSIELTVNVNGQNLTSTKNGKQTRTQNPSNLLVDDRKGEITLTAVSRQKPTFKKREQSSDRGASKTEKETIKHQKTAVSILSQFKRDSSGRLRHATGDKKGQYASESEAKAYETAQREQNKESLKNQGVIAKLLEKSTDYLKTSADNEAIDAVGAAGGSFFYAAKDLASLTLDMKNGVSDLFDGFGNASATSAEAQKNIDERSQKIAELSENKKQTESIQQQTKEQKKQYQKAIGLLEEISQNSKPEKEGLWGSLSSLLGDVIGGVGNRKSPKSAPKSTPKPAPAASATPKSTPKPAPAASATPKSTPKPAPAASATPQSAPKPATAASAAIATPKPAASTKPALQVLSKVGSGALNVAKNAPLLSTALTVGSAALAVKDREDLSTKDKAAHVAATSGGALAGAATGAAIGTAIPIPVVGTVVGATAGLILSYFGGKYGSKFGDFITSKETKEKGILSSVRESVGNAFKSSKSTISSVFDSAIKDGAKDVEIPVTIAQGRSILVSDTPDAVSNEKATSATIPNKNGVKLATKPKPFNRNDAAEKRIKKYDHIIEEQAKKYGVPSDLVRAVIRQESMGKADATSYAGAQGLMQLMPATAKDLGVANAYDPAQNIEGGTKYLSQHIKYFKKMGYDDEGAYKLSLASYNAGRGWVNSARKQTQNSLDADAVLQKLADPKMVRTAGGSPRAKTNINQTDHYFKTIMGNYAYRVETSKAAAATAATSKAQQIKKKVEAITATASNNALTAESVSAIDAKTQAIAPQPQKVIVTNPPAKTENIKTVGTNTGKATSNNKTTINNIKTANGVVIPTDFDDQNLRLVALDLN